MEAGRRLLGPGFAPGAGSFEKDAKRLVPGKAVRLPKPKHAGSNPVGRAQHSAQKTRSALV